MKPSKVPRERMVSRNKTLAELGYAQTDYPIKFRLKEFEVVHADGSRHRRGPCISIQQFNPDGHFIAAISFALYEADNFAQAFGRAIALAEQEESGA